MFADDEAGRFAWMLMGGTLCYAADLVPEISDDIVNIDRAMRWGFNWAQGPFELLDTIGPARFVDRIRSEGAELPRMLQVLVDAGASSFYRGGGAEDPEGQFLAIDGSWQPIPS